MKLLWICCYDVNYPWGAEAAMMDGFLKSDWEIDCVDYRMAQHLGVDIYNVISRKSKNSDAILIQRGEGLDLTKITTNKPLFYFATEGAANEDQIKSFDQLLGLVTKIFARKETAAQAISIGHDPDDVLLFTLPYNNLHYKPISMDKIYDVIVSGTITPRRQKIFNQIIEEVNIWGKAGHTAANGAECNKIYNMAKMVINVHAYDVLDTETRIFEVMATSALLITEEPADNVDISDKCMIFKHNDIDQCLNLIKQLDKKSNQYKPMIKKANKMAEENSWAVKAGVLLNMIEEYV